MPRYQVDLEVSAHASYDVDACDEMDAREIATMMMKDDQPWGWDQAMVDYASVTEIDSED